MQEGGVPGKSDIRVRLPAEHALCSAPLKQAPLEPSLAVHFIKEVRFCKREVPSRGDGVADICRLTIKCGHLLHPYDTWQSKRPLGCQASPWLPDKVLRDLRNDPDFINWLNVYSYKIHCTYGLGYVFHKEDCDGHEFDSFKNHKDFYYRGKSSSNSPKSFSFYVFAERLSRTDDSGKSFLLFVLVALRISNFDAAVSCCNIGN